MAKKRYTSTIKSTQRGIAKSDTLIPAVSFDGKGRDFKDVVRFLILGELLERSAKFPTRIFTLLGSECSDLLLWLQNRLNIESCVSVEMFENEFNIQKKNIKAKFGKFAKQVHPYHCNVRQYFSGTHKDENKKTKKDKELFKRFFDLIFLDYIGCYNGNMIQDIKALCNNEEMFHSILAERGSIRLSITTSGRFQNPDEDRTRLHELESTYNYLSPKIDESSDTAKEGHQLHIDHLDAYGIHYSVSEMFRKIGIRCEQVHCLYYRDGNQGTRMLLSSWKLTKISGYEHSGPNSIVDCDLLPPLPPVYLGFRNRKNHSQSMEWAADMRKRQIITFRDDELNQIDRSHKNLRKLNPKVHKKVDAVLRRLGSFNPTLLEITQEENRGIIPQPIDPECKLALLEAGKISKPRSNTKEDWAKMAVAIANCLKAHKGPVCQSTLIKTVLGTFPEYKHLQTSQAGNLNQSKLTNAMAWAKSALKQGGYTLSKKDCIAGEILKLTKKGHETNLNRAFKNTWNEHFALIKGGKL
jgi:hypothetical protein